MEFNHNPDKKIFSKELFEKYKCSDASEPYGVIFEEDKTVGIIYVDVGDILVPILVTYDRLGNKIDSLYLFENASGFNVESETFELVTIFPDKRIQVIDSTKTWLTDKEKENRISDSFKLEVDTFIHLVTMSGKILKNGK